jgi:hypothetical protein
MPITPSDIKWYRSATVADTAANGGRMGNAQSPSGIKNNIFPDVTLAERNAGTTRYRKMFIKVANAENIPLGNARVFLQLPTPGEDSVTFFPGTQRDTQAQITGGERLYGGGALESAASNGSQTIAVVTEGASLNCIRADDTLRITDRVSVVGTGNEEFAEVESVVYSGDVAAVLLKAALMYSFPAGAVVSSVYNAGEVRAEVSALAVTSAAGALLDGLPPLGDSIGSVEQDWTLSFTSATAFTITGDTLGSIGSGNTTSGAAPINPVFPGRPYFTLPASAFSGVFAPGDRITFTTSPAAVPVWYRQLVPAGAAAISGNQVVLGVDGESA